MNNNFDDIDKVFQDYPNNGIYFNLAYGFDLNDEQIQQIFSMSDVAVPISTCTSYRRRPDNSRFVEISKKRLVVFMKGLSISKNLNIFVRQRSPELFIEDLCSHYNLVPTGEVFTDSVLIRNHLIKN